MKKRFLLIAISILASSTFMSIAMAGRKAWNGLSGGGGD
jgi:hypothetical protein